MPLLLPAPHIYVATCISPADIHRIASGAPDILQTCMGPISVTADPSTSISSLLHNPQLIINLTISFVGHSRCKMPSSSSPAFTYASCFSSDRTVSRCHVLMSRFTSTRTRTRPTPLAKRDSRHVKLAIPCQRA